MSLESVLHRLRAAEVAAGRPPGSVRLVAVSKEQPEDRVQAVLDAGHRRFGENRVQEAERRWAARRGAVAGLELHLIGPLQTNKAKAAVGLFDVIQTLDRPKLARALADLAAARGRSPVLYVQVNTGAEPQKAGVLPGEADAFLAEVRALGLPVSGLMCIPPLGQPPGPHFRLLRAIAERHGLAELSMGMSDDFETAVAEGATVVRIGSAIFGPRSGRG